MVGLLLDHPKKAFTTKWHGHCHCDEQTWWSQFHVRFSISGSTGPNLQVAVTHVRQIYSQHSFGLPLGMNGIHRMQSGYARMNLSVKTLIKHLPICNAPLPFWSMESRINTTMALRLVKKKMIVLQGLNVRLVQFLVLFQFYALSALHKKKQTNKQTIPRCLIHHLKELELLQEDRRPKQKCKSLAKKMSLTYWLS